MQNTERRGAGVGGLAGEVARTLDETEEDMCQGSNLQRAGSGCERSQSLGT